MRAFILAVLMVLTVCLVAQVMPSSRRIVAPTPAVVAGGCATSDTTLPHDELLEGWEGDGTENTWSFSGAVSGVTITLPSDSSGLATGKPTGACDQAMRVQAVAESTTASFYTWNRGSTVDTNVTSDFVFYFWLETGPDAGESFRVIVGNNSATSSASVQWYVSLVGATGPVPKLQATGSTSTSTTTTNGTIATGQWYKVAIHNENTDTSSTMTINDWTPLTFQRANNPVQYIHTGFLGAIAVGESGTYDMDLYAWNTP